MTHAGSEMHLSRRRCLGLCVGLGVLACRATTPPVDAVRADHPPGTTAPTAPTPAATVAGRPTTAPVPQIVETPAPQPTATPQVPPSVAVPTPVDPERQVWAVAAQGRHAYAGVGSRLVVVDVADPARPAEIARTAPFPARVRAVAVQGTRVYVGLEPRRDGVLPSGRGVRVLDASDPARPREVGAFDNLRSGMVFALWDRYLYAADLDRGLRVIDVADPSRPFEAGYYAQGHVDLVAAAGGRAYVDDVQRDLRVLDVANPTKITQVALLPIGGFGAMALGDGTLVLSGPAGSLTFLDVAEPGPPTIVGAYHTQPPPRLVPQSYAGVWRAGRYVYAAAPGRGGMDVIDAGDPRKPSLAGHVAAAGVPAGRLLLQASGTDLHILDATTPTQPVPVGSIGF